MPIEYMKDWNGKDIRVAQSKRGKVCVCNYRDNLIIPEHSTWPHHDIEKKLRKSGRSKDFDEQTLGELSKELGFYCDLQSLRSEDALTWSVFGTLHYFPEQTKVLFVNSLLRCIGESLIVNDCSIQLWERITHPDTGGAGGPELDFLIVCDKLVILGESKWMADEDKHQGKNNDKSQLQLRVEFKEKYGEKYFQMLIKL